MNFAEAALVIQGSACVYSKKVYKLQKLQSVTCVLSLHFMVILFSVYY